MNQTILLCTLAFVGCFSLGYGIGWLVDAFKQLRAEAVECYRICIEWPEVWRL